MIGLIRQQGDDGDPESPVKHYPGHGSPVKTVLSKLQRANTKGGKNQKWAWSHPKSLRVTNREVGSEERTLISPCEMEPGKGWRKRRPKLEHHHMVKIMIFL